MSTAYRHASLNLSGVFAGSGRIINAPNNHLWALSLFFLVPLSFCLMFHPVALQSQSDSLVNRYNLQQSFFFFTSSNTSPHPTKTELLLPLVYSLFVLVLSLVIVSTITYTSFRVFDGSPVNLVSSIKSVLHSFIPLLSTLIYSLLIMSLIVLFFAFLAALVYKGLFVLGFDIDHLQSNYFMFLLVRIVVLVTLIWLQVNWSLWAVIVVVESKWGYESLRRSRYLVNGMRGVALSLMFYDLLIGYMVYGASTSVENARQTNGWLNWMFVFSMLVSSGVITMFTSRLVVANLVLYMYCKALHGELAIEIAEEFANEDTSLPFDYDKISHLL